MPVNFTPTAAGTYTVIITGSCNGNDCEICSFTFKVKNPGHEIGSPLSNQYNLPEYIKLSAVPNPARDIITLQLSAPEPESGVIGWYDELGIARKQEFTAWDGSETTIEMNVSDLPEGIYFVRFDGINGSGFVKVIIFR